MLTFCDLVRLEKMKKGIITNKKIQIMNLTLFLLWKLLNLCHQVMRHQARGAKESERTFESLESNGWYGK